MTKASKHKTPPTLTIDLDDQFAWMRVIVVLVWGGKPRRMDQALATISAEGLGVLHELSKRPIRPLDLQALSRAMDLPINELARMPGARAFYQGYFTHPAHSATQLWDSVFDPNGHFLQLVSAPAWDTLLSELNRTTERDGFFAGMLLFVVARLAERHPETPASLNRAIAVLKAAWGPGTQKLPSNLLQIWKRWRHLAPLWAAYNMEVQDAQALGFTSDAAALEAVHDPKRLKRILGMSKWFQRFAESFAADRARGALIPPGKALQIVADADEVKPEFKLLLPEDLAAARAYHAPKYR
jgi:hypothetical protein